MVRRYRENVGSLYQPDSGGVFLDRAGAKVTLQIGAGILAVGLGLGALAASSAMLYAAATIAGSGSGVWRVAIPPVLMMPLTGTGTRARGFAWNVGLLTG